MKPLLDQLKLKYDNGDNRLWTLLDIIEEQSKTISFYSSYEFPWSEDSPYAARADDNLTVTERRLKRLVESK